MVCPGLKQIELGTTRGGWRQNDWKVKRIKQGTPAIGQPANRSESSIPHSATRISVAATAKGQSTRTSDEAANHRGAKGYRKIDRERTDNWKTNQT